jgi:hypothetical protein
MKLWIDDVRPAPEGYVCFKSVNEAKNNIEAIEKERDTFVEKAQYQLNHHDLQGFISFLDMASRREIEVIDIDHDAGDYFSDGGDYIKLLDWLEATGRNYPIRIHSQNVVGRQNMQRIVERNGWKEVR